MSQKKIPLRKCIGCGNMLPKKELIRVVHTPEDEFFIDTTGKRNGRGAYICPDAECLEKALKTKAINRSFSANVPDEIGEKLKKELSDCV